MLWDSRQPRPHHWDHHVFLNDAATLNSQTEDPSSPDWLGRSSIALEPTKNSRPVQPVSVARYYRDLQGIFAEVLCVSWLSSIWLQGREKPLKVFHCCVKIFHNSQIGLLIAVKPLLVCICSTELKNSEGRHFLFAAHRTWYHRQSRIIRGISDNF